MKQTVSVNSSTHPVSGVMPTRTVSIPFSVALVVALGAITATAHLGNNFTPYLIGGLIDLFGFSPLQMGVWSMVELLAYAATMLFIAPHVVRLSPRRLALAAGALIGAAQFSSSLLDSFIPLLVTRVACGLGFGLANTALNLTAARTDSPTRAISIGLAVQTIVYTLINLALPVVGTHHGTPGMFIMLAVLALLFTIAGGSLLPDRPSAPAFQTPIQWNHLKNNGRIVLIAISLFSFGSLALWPFIERAAHEIGISAVIYGRYQSIATLACAVSNTVFGVLAPRIPRRWSLPVALLICGLSCAALTLVSNEAGFAIALIVFNVSWLIAYPLILSVAYQIDAGGRLSVLCSSAWIVNMAAGSLVTGAIAQWLGSYVLVGPLGLISCVGAFLLLRPLVHSRVGSGE